MTPEARQALRRLAAKPSQSEHEVVLTRAVLSLLDALDARAGAGECSTCGMRAGAVISCGACGAPLPTPPDPEAPR